MILRHGNVRQAFWRGKNDNQHNSEYSADIILECVQDLKVEFMLRLAPFDKTSETLFYLLAQSLQT